MKGKQRFYLSCVVLSLAVLFFAVQLSSVKVQAEEGVGGFVNRCYQVALGRDADPNGYADWTSQLTNGQTDGATVAYGFIFSPEYTNSNKDNGAYVTDLYTMFLGRTPDEGGYNDWVGQLDAGADRLSVFAGFANSVEFSGLCTDYGVTAGLFTTEYDLGQVNNVNMFVARMYRICLSRLGDQVGQADWTSHLLRGELTGIECASGFINSQEYQNLGLSNSDYVKNMYRAFMGREYDEAGYKDWVSKLNAGYTRDEIFAGFANSNEFKSICDSYGIIRGNYVATNVHDENSLREITEVEVEQEEQPATQPTQQPSEQPATQPSQQPSAQPTQQPSSQPTSQPTAGGACNHVYPSTPFSVSEATCESAREEIYQCTKCGATLYKTVGQPLGHQMKKTEHEDAECTSGGYDFYECSRAGCTYYERVDIPALGHNMALNRTIAGTCMTTRTDVYKCKRCGEEERRDGAKGTHVLSDEGYAATCINDGRKAQYCDVCRQFITDEVIPAKGHHAVLKADANGKKYITCEDCGIEFRYSTQLGTEDNWRALNSNHVLYLQQGHGGRCGFGKIVASVAGKTWDELYEEDYNQYEKIQADFWKRVKFEIGDETIVSRWSQKGSFTYDGKTEDYFTTGLCNGWKRGTTTVKVYWDDVLYDSFTVKVGDNLVEAVKEYYNNPNPDENVLNGFDSAGRDAVANIVKMLKSTITDDMTDYQKVAAIKNWYDAKITYDSNRDDSAPYFNVFLNKRGICHDYALTFSMLMDVLDIECYYIKGPSDNGKTKDYHAWNMVRLDAGNGKGLQWYYVDTTWHEFDTTYTVQELNARDGEGRYNALPGNIGYRIAERYRKYQPEEYSGDGKTLAQLQNEGDGFTEFSSFPY